MALSSLVYVLLAKNCITKPSTAFDRSLRRQPGPVTGGRELHHGLFPFIATTTAYSTSSFGHRTRQIYDPPDNYTAIDAVESDDRRARHVDGLCRRCGAKRTTDFVNLHAGNLGFQTLVPGLYKYGTGVTDIPLDVTLAGGADDVWIFQDLEWSRFEQREREF